MLETQIKRQKTTGSDIYTGATDRQSAGQGKHTSTLRSKMMLLIVCPHGPFHAPPVVARKTSCNSVSDSVMDKGRQHLATQIATNLLRAAFLTSGN